MTNSELIAEARSVEPIIGSEHLLELIDRLADALKEQPKENDVGSKKSKRKAAKLIAASQARRTEPDTGWKLVGEVPPADIIENVTQAAAQFTDARYTGYLKHGQSGDTRLIEWGEVQAMRQETEIILGTGSSDNPWYYGTVAPVEASDEQLADGEEETPPRWEIEAFGGPDGEWFVRDHLTGFLAWEDDRDGAESLRYELAVDNINLQSVSWREEQSGAEVLVSTEDETNRFHFILHHGEDKAYYDRDTKRVKPIGSDVPIEVVFEQLGELNDDWGLAEAWEQFWMPVHAWLIPPPEDIEVPVSDEVDPAPLPESEDAPAPAAHETPDLPPVRVLVVSSRRWAWQGIVAELIQTYWNGLDNPPLVLLTSGSPYGAEATASRLAGTVPGVTHEFIRDEDIPRSKIDYAFAFITNKSAGAERVLKLVRQANVPVHIMRETSAVINDPWLDR